MGESDLSASGPPPQFFLPSGRQFRRPGGFRTQIQGRQYGSYLDAVEEMSCVWVLQRRNSGDGCDLASTFCRYDSRKGDLCVLSWARMRREMWEVSLQS